MGNYYKNYTCKYVLQFSQKSLSRAKFSQYGHNEGGTNYHTCHNMGGANNNMGGANNNMGGVNHGRAELTMVGRS